MKNAAELKIELLVNGINISNFPLSGLGERFQEKLYSYSLTDWTDKKLILPSDIKLDDRVYVGFRFDPTSEWNLVQNADKFFLKNGQVEVPTQLISRPYWYDRTLNNSTLTQSLAVSCGNHAVSFFINSYCQYFSDGSNCKFCGLVPTQKSFNDMKKNKTPEQIKETLEIILSSESKLDFIQMSGGSLFNHDREIQNYFPFISVVSEVLGKYNRNDIPIHLTCMPPKDLSLLEELKNRGLNTISFDLECTSKTYFEKYCPGKSRTTGFEGMLNALEHAQILFGQNNVFSIVLMGIEPKDIFIPGVENLLKRGIIPTLNVYHHDPFCSSDMDILKPNVADITESMYKIGDIFRKYNARAGKLGCAHYDMGHEINKGYF